MCFSPSVPEGVLDVGTIVWAHTSKIRYYHGFVSYKGTKLHVDLYDGDKFVYGMKDASRRVIPDVPPKAADIKPGTRVIAKFKKKPRYYSSTVMKIDASDPSEPKYHVKLDDGDETWDSLYQLRLLPKEVHVEGTLVAMQQAICELSFASKRNLHSYQNVFHLQIHFHTNQSNFHMKSFARGLGPRKWPILSQRATINSFSFFSFLCSSILMMLTLAFLHYVSLGEEKFPDHINAKEDTSSNAELVKSCLKSYECYLSVCYKHDYRYLYIVSTVIRRCRMSANRKV